MEQETNKTTLADYHNLHKKPVKKYHVSQVYDAGTNRKRWGVAWFAQDGGMVYRYPVAYGMRAAVRLANRLNKVWDKFKASV